MTEEEIIKGCIDNNPQCQHALFRLHAKTMMGICLRYIADTSEAEDILQETFIKIFKTIGQFRFEGPLGGWIRRITVRTCLAALHKKHIQYSDISAADLAVDPNALQAVSVISEKELTNMIRQLPEGYRIVFNLYVIEGYSHEEIAGMLNIETVTSRSQLVKARKLLQRQISLQQKIIIHND